MQQPEIFEASKIPESYNTQENVLPREGCQLYVLPSYNLPEDPDALAIRLRSYLNAYVVIENPLKILYVDGSKLQEIELKDIAKFKQTLDEILEKGNDECKIFLRNEFSGKFPENDQMNAYVYSRKTQKLFYIDTTKETKELPLSSTVLFEKELNQRISQIAEEEIKQRYSHTLNFTNNEISQLINEHIQPNNEDSLPSDINKIVIYSASYQQPLPTYACKKGYVYYKELKKLFYINSDSEETELPLKSSSDFEKNLKRITKENTEQYHKNKTDPLAYDWIPKLIQTYTGHAWKKKKVYLSPEQIVMLGIKVATSDSQDDALVSQIPINSVDKTRRPPSIIQKRRKSKKNGVRKNINWAPLPPPHKEHPKTHYEPWEDSSDEENANQNPPPDYTLPQKIIKNFFARPIDTDKKRSLADILNELSEKLNQSGFANYVLGPFVFVTINGVSCIILAETLLQTWEVPYDQIFTTGLEINLALTTAELLVKSVKKLAVDNPTAAAAYKHFLGIRDSIFPLGFILWAVTEMAGLVFSGEYSGYEAYLLAFSCAAISMLLTAGPLSTSLSKNSHIDNETANKIYESLKPILEMFDIDLKPINIIGKKTWEVRKALEAIQLTLANINKEELQRLNLNLGKQSIKEIAGCIEKANQEVEEILKDLGKKTTNKYYEKVSSAVYQFGLYQAFYAFLMTTINMFTQVEIAPEKSTALWAISTTGLLLGRFISGLRCLRATLRDAVKVEITIPGQGQVLSKALTINIAQEDLKNLLYNLNKIGSSKSNNQRLTLYAVLLAGLSIAELKAMFDFAQETNPENEEKIRNLSIATGAVAAANVFSGAAIATGKQVFSNCGKIISTLKSCLFGSSQTESAPQETNPLISRGSKPVIKRFTIM